MLTIVGSLTIVLLLAVIVSGRASPMVALIAVPTVASLVSGFGLKTAAFIVSGIRGVAPVAGMFIFAIIYFGVMTDAGLLDPIVDRILKFVGHHPSRIVVGTAFLALIIHLDGSGAVTFLVTVPVMLPIYQRLGMDKRILACSVSLAAGVNFLPWTGPMIRAAAALHVPVSQLFTPLIPVQMVGLVFVFVVCFWLGKKEERRLGLKDTVGLVLTRTITEPEKALRRPRLFWVNLTITVLLIVVMVAANVEPVVVFMIGVVLALMVNYPNVEAQRARIDAHAKAALLMAGILFAAGAFTGIMTESGMLKEMARTSVTHIPAGAARHIPFVMGVISMPLSFLFDPDSFYFGIVPVLAEVTKSLGTPAVQVGQAAVLGQMTTGFPVSPLTPATFLLVGLAEIELGEHQRFSSLYLFLASLVMTIACVAFGVFAL